MSRLYRMDAKDTGMEKANEVTSDVVGIARK